MIYWLLYSIPDEASIPYIFSTILSTRVATSREHCIWTPRTLCTSMLFRVVPCCLDFLFIFDLPNCNTSHLICHFSPMCNWFISCSILWQSSSQSAIPPILLCHLQTNQPIYSFCPSHLYITNNGVPRIDPCGMPLATNSQNNIFPPSFPLSSV